MSEFHHKAAIRGHYALLTPNRRAALGAAKRKPSAYLANLTRAFKNPSIQSSHE